jgi:choloylglycine hydrolase
MAGTQTGLERAADVPRLNPFRAVFLSFRADSDSDLMYRLWLVIDKHGNIAHQTQQEGTKESRNNVAVKPNKTMTTKNKQEEPVKTNITLLALTLLAAINSALAPSTHGCTRIFLNLDSQQMIVARTYDLYRDDAPRLVYFPRGLEHTGAALPNAVRWVSKYASVGITSFDACNSDGMNEKGLAAHLLYLDGSKYPANDGTPALANMAWAQYVMDNCATVNEALEGLAKLRVIDRQAIGRDWPLHLSMEDATGDSAVIESVNGKLVVYHGKEFTVMGNEPALDEQLANLKKYKLFGGKLPMPGDIDPMSRFVRAASYLKTLPKAQNSDEAVAYVGGVVRACMVPFGAVDTSGGSAADTWPTRWASISDLSRKRFYFLSTRSPNVIWIDMDKLAGARDLMAILPNPALSGDVSGQLKKFTPEQKEYPPAH